MEQEPIDLSNGVLDYTLCGPGGVELTRYGLLGFEPWAGGVSVPFCIYANGDTMGTQKDDLQAVAVGTTHLWDGSSHTTVRMRWSRQHLEIEDHTVVYAGTALVERWQVVRNTGAATIRIDRFDSICFSIPHDEYEIIYFESGWGREFEAKRKPLAEVRVLQCQAGRSSQGAAPWFALVRPDGQILTASVMWSGNWIVRFDRGVDGGYRISGGLHDWEFFKNLAPGDSMESPHVAAALGTNGDFNTVSTQYARVGRNHWYPYASLASHLPVEWNHWWSYEDRDLSAEVILRNAEVAAAIGVEVCAVDAGWFGPADVGSDWFAYRGDWDTVNTARFPRGIRFVADRIHELGMKFGLWCEIEALGEHARLAASHPDFAATRGNTSLGYICFGNPEVREWAYRSLDRLITDYTADWLKLDFNLDPGAGCTRTDHGHGAGDGLYEHYMGLYETLERIRLRHPDVVLENCSSGGLRTDLGMARQTHLTFLSDLDWPEHSLRVFQGATTFLSPGVLLHWSFSLWKQEQPHQTFNPWDPRLTVQQFDFYLRVAMIHAFGICQKLPDLPEWILERLKMNIQLYKIAIRRFVQSARLHHLSEQLHREGEDDRWVAFQYSMPDNAEHLVIVFRLTGAKPGRIVRLTGLDPASMFMLTWFDDERTAHFSGEDLMRLGLPTQGMEEEESVIVLIQRVAPITADGGAYLQSMNEAL